MYFDIIVVGAGNAGCEAAAAAARIGANVLLITKSINEIALMPCNPSIGEINGVKSVAGIVTECGNSFTAKSVVIATGTFLNGNIYIGREVFSAGRMGSSPTIFLAEAIKRCGIRTGTLKTGTPPRLNGKTINWMKCEVKKGDEKPMPFSFLNKEIKFDSVDCYTTYTNDITHSFIKENQRDHAAIGIYSAMFENINGPRYCMSIHDKVKRFPNKNGHQIFLEPEDMMNDVIYPGGISTSFSASKQLEMMRTISGLEDVEILLPGYLIGYDFVYPSEIKRTLETKKLKGLFLAGQINGTTGYEEAGAQGIVAGINAALSIDNKSFILQRDEAYMGVMIDDIIMAGDITEPYRVFTTRSEYRLLLRSDNANFRLTKKGYEVGVVGERRFKEFLKLSDQVDRLKDLMKNTFVDQLIATGLGVQISGCGLKKTAYQMLSHNGCNVDIVRAMFSFVNEFDDAAIEQVVFDGKYEPYIKKQNNEIGFFNGENNLLIPSDIDYSQIAGLSTEAREKFCAIRPKDIEEA
uniref:tRNA uridine 5-carboxymethylaminomethyl modification enzyme C-terminal subdomain domain-containing protein n=1 Tax=Biomphalaria glabrata TaxID=6526 RepID=A0A2C9K8B9_BIOGL